MNFYQFHDTVVLRHPVYSFRQFNEESLATKLLDDFFQNAIYLCSPVVFNELKKCDFEYAKLDNKLKNTLLKYYNRMCYRPTPFALCAAVSTVNWSQNGGHMLLNSAKSRPYVKLSYDKSLQVAAEVRQTIKNQLWAKTNATLYKKGKQIRYIKSLQGTDDKITFCIASAEATRVLNRIVSFAAELRSKNEIEVFIVHETYCSPIEANKYLCALLEEQILVDADAPNITGPDYLDRLAAFTSKDRLNKINSLYQDLEQVKDAPSLKTYLTQHRRYLQKNNLYVNLKSNIENGKIDKAHQQVVLDGLYCLAQLNQLHVPNGINQFLKQFNQKFEGQTIPLLLALDPEMGVGYQELNYGSESLNFTEGINWVNESAQTTTIKWEKLQLMILKKWMAGGKYESVKITASDLQGLDGPVPNKLPSTLSVMFRPLGKKVLIEQVAGVTAASLIGRFTPANTEIDALARDIASYEVNSNPDIIYAEIVHVCHKHTANIDRRNHIYPYEIIILTPSTLNEHHQIPLSDLYVAVQNNELILWSAKHGKRVVPRLSSAFNYQRDDLAAFRFLCDLQYVGVQTNFNFIIENIFPGLDFYPRVEFEQAILQCAQWHLDEPTIRFLTHGKDKEKNLSAFNQLRRQVKFCRHVALTQHDHQLIFDLDKSADVTFFLNTIQSSKNAIIKEVLTDGINKPILRDENNEGIITQFIATLYHKEKIYRPKVLNLPALKQQSARAFLPGTNWLYFKLYSHQARTNEIIANVIYQTIKQAFAADLITQWFFTRYNDPEHHIRFRLKVRLHSHQKVIELVNRAVGPYQRQGLLSNVVIDTYRRELERYPDIDAFEKIFYASSSWVCHYLNSKWQQLTQEDCLSFAFLTTRKLFEAAGFSTDERLEYLTHIVDAFLKEFGQVPGLKYQLDLTYRKHKATLFELATKPVLSPHSKLHKFANECSKNLAIYFNQIKALPVQNKFKHFSDIVHMHLNRIFADQPREQEFTLYYMLLKYEKARKHINPVE